MSVSVQIRRKVKPRRPCSDTTEVEVSYLYVFYSVHKDNNIAFLGFVDVNLREFGIWINCAVNGGIE